MTLRRLDRHEWATYLDPQARRFAQGHVEAQVSSLSRCCQLRGIVHDRRRDVIHIELADTALQIDQPTALYADGAPYSWNRLVLVDGAGRAEVLRVLETTVLSGSTAVRTSLHDPPSTIH